MSFNLSDVEVVKHYFGEFCRQKKEAKFSLLIAGEIGVGKSSLVNALLGREVAKVGFNKDRRTCEGTQSFRVAIEGVNIRVWDCPGVEDDSDNAEKYLAEIGRKMTDKLDLVIFCLRMDNRRFRRDDMDTFKLLTKMFGTNMCTNAVIALTFADKVEHPAMEDKEAYFLEELAHWREALQVFLSMTIKLDPELVRSLPIVPTGYYRQASPLPSGANWLSKFWIACYNVARKSTAFNLYRINIARVRFPGSEEVAAICGGSEVAPTTPGLDDSEISPIDLDEEQQESFWNTTWEAFKEYCSSIGVVLSAISTVGIAILRGFAR